MALSVDLVVDYDTDVILPFVVWEQDGLTDEELQAQIDAGTATRKDLTGASLAFYVRKKASPSSALLIYKSTEESPADVFLDGTFGGSPDQLVKVRLRDSDVYDADSSPQVDLKAGKYYFGLKRLGDDIETLLVKGTITFDPSAAVE